jgi:hypothetical protein
VHSKIVGGSTAKRVIACPGSVALSEGVPNLSTSYALDGTLCHTVIADVLDVGRAPEEFVGFSYDGGPKLTETHVSDKLKPALALFADAVDPDGETAFTVETRVDFGEFLPGVFGTIDLLGRRGDRAIVLDWKFGDGVMVDAEENEQLLFYAAAALRTRAVAWVFDGAKDLELIIIQPPMIRRWVTTFDRVRQFEMALARAVKIAQAPGAPLAVGDHCRFCPAKVKCPEMTGAVDRARHLALEKMGSDDIGAALVMADRIEEWISAVRATAHAMLAEGVPVTGYKLVPKRATRQWVDADRAVAALGETIEMYERTVLSPAKAEKALKKIGSSLPDDLVVAVSSGDTIAPTSDPRADKVLIGAQLTRALSKIGV